MYKDKALQRGTTLARVRRYRALHNKGKGVTQSKALQIGVTKAVSHQPVKTNSAQGNVERSFRANKPKPIVTRSVDSGITYSKNPWAARVSRGKPAGELTFSKRRQIGR